MLSSSASGAAAVWQLCRDGSQLQAGHSTSSLYIGATWIFLSVEFLNLPIITPLQRGGERIATSAAAPLKL